MRLIVNGKEQELETVANVSELVRSFDSDGKYIAVALNRNFIPKAEYGATAIKEMDEVEILSPSQGG